MKIALFAAMILLSSVAMAKNISVQVKGMVCSMCAQGIEKKFKKMPEVKNIKVDLDKKIVSIETNETQDLTDSKITEIITEAGYNVANIERK